MASDPRRVLVTGGAGAIGSHVVDGLLARGDRVLVLDCFHDFYPRAIKERNLAAARSHTGFAGLVEADVRDAAAVEETIAGFRPEAIAHLAGRAGVRPSVADPVGYSDVNTRGTAAVFEAARKHGVARCVLASSSSVYGERERGPFDEDDRADRPLSPYGASKRGAELVAHSLWHAHGLPVACLRFFTCYGPRQRPDLAIHKWSRLALAGEPLPIYGDGSAERDFTFASDLVDGVIRALDRASAFHIYNIGRGEPVTMKQTLDALERALGVPLKRDYQEPQTGDMPRTWASIERARTELGYAPRVRLDAGIAAFVEWLRGEGSSGA